MANYVLQELPEEMTDGKKVIFPKMQAYSLHDFDTVIKHMRDYAGNLSEGTRRAVFDAFTSVMESWMPMGHTIKVDGLGVFSLSLGFDTSTPSEKEMQHSSNTAKEPKDSYRHVCIKNINFARRRANKKTEQSGHFQSRRNKRCVTTTNKTYLRRTNCKSQSNH